MQSCAVVLAYLYTRRGVYLGLGVVIAQVIFYDRTSLSAPRKKNYDSMVERIKLDVIAGTAGELALLDIDRNGENYYKSGQITYDYCPSLRVKGPDIFVLTVSDLHKPCSEMRYHGFLPDSVRFPLVGHSPTVGDYLPSQRGKRSGTGNAFAVPSLAAALIPLVGQAVKSGVRATAKRPAKNTAELHDLAAYREYKRLRSAPSAD